MWEKWPRMSSRKCPGNSSTDKEPLVSTSATDRWEFEKATQQVHTGEQQNIKIQPAESSTKKRSSLTRVAPSLQNQATCHLAAFQPSNRGYRPAHAAKAPRFQSHAQGKPYIWDRFSRCLACAGGSQTNPWDLSFPVSNLNLYILSTHTHPPLKKHTRTA